MGLVFSTPLKPFTFQLMMRKIFSFFFSEKELPGCHASNTNNVFQPNNRLMNETKDSNGFAINQKIKKTMFNATK